jgi:tetratricopeptide (TPR) repeat protein
MKMISKIAKVALGLVFVGSSVFAQSLDDAKKAIDAEQYQKAKSMLKNLTTTQPTKDENFFYLGWVYLIQEYPDSAAAQFTKGTTVDPKSALNYVGLGAVAHLTKDAVGVTSNFTKAVSLTSKKDSKPYLYMGKAYLLLPAGVKEVSKDDATAAIAVLNKGAVANPKDVEVLVTLGDANRAIRNTTEAYNNYSSALTLDPKSLTANVAEGILWENAQNFEDAEKQFKAAIAIDPNFGPAYREWAETDLYWAKTVRTVASAKVKEAVEHYQKFLSLTDESVESLLRYADFLYNAGDYKTLQDVAAKLSKSANSNARVYRYIGYSAYETKDYQAGLDAMNNWFKKAEPARILPTDYLVLGRLQIASGKDTAGGIATLKKVADMDSTQTETIYSTDLNNVYKARKDYLGQAKNYEEETGKIHRPLLTEHFYEANYYYYAFDSKKPDSTLLVKADSAASYVQRISTKPLPDVFLLRARIVDYKDKDFSKMQGTAKPFYDKYIDLITTAGPNPPTDARIIKGLAEAYAYEGNYSLYHDKDDAKANDFFTKSLAIDPNNYYAKFYFSQKAAASSAPAPTTKSGTTKKP